MTKTLIDIDDLLLSQARDVLGVTTKRDTVNGSLRETVRLGAIQEFVRSIEGSGHKEQDGLVLVDATAFALHAQCGVAARLLPLLVTDRIATCAAVEHELLTLAGKADSPLTAVRGLRLRWLATEDADLRRAAELQAELIHHGTDQIPWHRLVIAAVAERHGVPLLHHTAEYDALTKLTGQPTEWARPDQQVEWNNPATAT
jgi:predicted nucleic acid-binding protein/Arc/MetJ family transcription regulator